MSMPIVDPNEKPELLRRVNEVSARRSIRAATIGGAALVLLDVLGGRPGAFLLAGRTLLGSAVIASAIKARP